MYNKYSGVNKCFECNRSPTEVDGCHNGAYNEDLERCLWKQVIDNDLEKMVIGNNTLTFDIFNKLKIKEDKK